MPTDRQLVQCVWTTCNATATRQFWVPNTEDAGNAHVFPYCADHAPKREDLDCHECMSDVDEVYHDGSSGWLCEQCLLSQEGGGGYR